MIQSFKHKGLEQFFRTGKKSGIQAKHAKKLKLILGRLNASVSPDDMNWRVTFRFNGDHAEIVNYEDYH